MRPFHWLNGTHTVRTGTRRVYRARLTPRRISYPARYPCPTTAALRIYPHLPVYRLSRAFYSSSTSKQPGQRHNMHKTHSPCNVQHRLDYARQKASALHPTAPQSIAHARKTTAPTKCTQQPKPPKITSPSIPQKQETYTQHTQNNSQ